MTAPRSSVSLLEDLEHQLCSHPRFGDSDFIRARAVDVHGWSMSILSADLLAKNPTLEGEVEAGDIAAYRFLGDALVREHLRQVWVSAKRADEDSHERPLAALVADSIGRWSRAAPNGPLSAKMPRLVAASDDVPWFWRSSGAPDEAEQEFLQLCQSAFPELSFDLLSGSQDDAGRIRSALALLRACLPELTHSVMKHVHGIVLVGRRGGETDRPEEDELFISASTDTVPGIVFLSRPALGSIHLLAESLLHEATHNKLYELWSCQGILSAGASAGTLQVEIPWADSSAWDSNTWPVTRVLAAQHVYLHLIAFFVAVLRAENLEAFGVADRVEFEKCLETAIGKADFLSESLRGIGSDQLREEGLALIDWLTALLEHPHGVASDSSRRSPAPAAPQRA